MGAEGQCGCLRRRSHRVAWSRTLAEFCQGRNTNDSSHWWHLEPFLSAGALLPDHWHFAASWPLSF